MKITANGKIHPLIFVAVIIASVFVGIMLLKLDHNRSDSNHETLNFQAENTVSRNRANFNKNSLRISSSDHNSLINQHTSVEAEIAKQPFTMSGISPIVSSDLGFDKQTIDLVTSHIFDARIKIAQLFVDNIRKLDKDGDGLAIGSYEFAAMMNDGLAIKNELINNINQVTGKVFDKEIERMLGGSASFLYCGTINYKFKIFEDDSSSSGISIVISGETVDGYKAVPPYKCDLQSFTRSTLIEFDVSK